MPPDPRVAALSLADLPLAAADHLLRRYALDWGVAQPPFGIAAYGQTPNSAWAPSLYPRVRGALTGLTHEERIGALAEGVTFPPLGLILDEEGVII